MEKLKNALKKLKNGNFIHDYIDWGNVDINNINFEQIVTKYYEKSNLDLNMDNLIKVIKTKLNKNTIINTDFYYDLFLDFKKVFNLFIKFNNYLRRTLIENVSDNEKILLNFYITQYAFLLKFTLSYQKLERVNYIKLLTLLNNIEYSVEDTLINREYKKIIVDNYYQLYEKYNLKDIQSYFYSDENNIEYYNYLKKTPNQDYNNINNIIYGPEKKIRNCSTLKEEECAEECEKIEQGSFFAWTGITKKSFNCVNRSDFKEMYKKSIENLSRKELIIFLCGYEQYDNEKLFYEIDYPDSDDYSEEKLIKIAENFIDNGLNQKYPENIIIEIIKRNFITNVVFLRIISYCYIYILNLFVYKKLKIYNFFDMKLFFSKIMENYEYIENIDKKELFYIVLYNFFPYKYFTDVYSDEALNIKEDITRNINYFYIKNKISIDVPFNFNGTYKLKDYDIINKNISIQNLYIHDHIKPNTNLILNMLSEYSFDVDDYKYELIKCLDENFDYEWNNTFPINVYLDHIKNFNQHNSNVEFEYVNLNISKIKYSSIDINNNNFKILQNYCTSLNPKDHILYRLYYKEFVYYYDQIPVVIKINNDYIVVKNQNVVYCDNVFGNKNIIVKLIKNYDNINSEYTLSGPNKIDVNTIITKPILQCIITQLYNNNSKYSFYDKKNIKSICIVSDESVNTDYFKKILGENFTYHNVSMRNCEIISSYFYKKTKKCDDNKDSNTNFEKLYKFDYDFYILYNNPVVPDNFYKIMNNEIRNQSNEFLYYEDKYFRYNRRDYIKINDDKNNKIFNFVDDYIELNLTDYHHSLALKLLIFKEKYISTYDLDYSKKHLDWYLNQNSYYSIFYSFFYSKLNYPKNLKLKKFIEYYSLFFKNGKPNPDYKIDTNKTPKIFSDLFIVNDIHIQYKDINFVHNKNLDMYLYFKEINNEMCVFELKMSDKKISIIKLDPNDIDNNEKNIIFNYSLFTGIKNEYIDILEKDIDLNKNGLIKKKNYILDLENYDLVIGGNKYVIDIANSIKPDFNFAIFTTHYPNINLVKNNQLINDINGKGYKLYYDPNIIYRELNIIGFAMVNKDLNLDINIKKIIEKNDDVFKLLDYYNSNKEKSLSNYKSYYNDFGKCINFFSFIERYGISEELEPNYTLNAFVFIIANLINILYEDNILYYTKPK